jgi:hypothetical protein
LDAGSGRRARRALANLRGAPRHPRRSPSRGIG